MSRIGAIASNSFPRRDGDRPGETFRGYPPSDGGRDQTTGEAPPSMLIAAPVVNPA